jgi:hypothetical protein
MNVNSSVRATGDTSAGTPTTRADDGKDTSGSPVEGRGTERDPSSRSQLEHQAQLFRDLMSGGPMTAGQLAELAGRSDPTMADARVLPELQHRWPGLSDELRDRSIDAAAFLAVEQRVHQGVVVQGTTAPASPDLTFAELVEKHVRRALASREAGGTRGGEIRIELSDAVLPGMALSLKRTPAGWRLEAESRNQDSLEKLSEFAPALVERFARASLGELIVSVADGG